MKIYTRTGDDGTTGLFGGQRVSKADPRLEAYGTIDELNAALGLAAVVAEGALAGKLRAIQNDLFVVGAHLATPPDSPGVAHLPPLTPEMIGRLEGEIDAADGELAPLKQFILPGGSEAAARLHLARTVCRRAERLLVGLEKKEGVGEAIIQYLNRLSDWCFVMARWSNKAGGVADVPWEKD